MSSFTLPQLVSFFLLASFVVEKLGVAVFRAPEGHEDEFGFHFSNPEEFRVAGGLALAPV